MQKPIFHSLGSNYTFSFAIKSLGQLFLPDRRSLIKVKQIFNQRFSGETYLFYKGRDAIEFALRALSIGKDDVVLTQAFTCHAIEEAVHRAGAQPVFVDLEKDELNPSVKTLEVAWKKAHQPKAILIQHTLGYPADMRAIRKWCTEKKVYLIEDLAQSFGGSDEQGVELGTYADVVICSFGRDKVIDAVSGGACILKKEVAAELEIQEGLRNIKVRTAVPFWIIARDMVYPILTWKIRVTHQFLIGQLLFQVAKKVNLLSSPITSPLPQMTVMPAQYGALVLEQVKNVDHQLTHRRQVAKMYINELADLPGSISDVKEKRTEAIHLRFPLRVDNPAQLTTYLAKQKIYLSDRWYRQPVDFGSLNRKSVYQTGSCPNAEDLAQHIFNLPTHQGIQSAEQIRIIKAVKTYYNT